MQQTVRCSVNVSAPPDVAGVVGVPAQPPVAGVDLKCVAVKPESVVAAHAPVMPVAPSEAPFVLHIDPS